MRELQYKASLQHVQDANNWELAQKITNQEITHEDFLEKVKNLSKAYDKILQGIADYNKVVQEMNK